MLLLFLVTVSSARLPVVKRNASPHLKWAKKAGDAKMKVIVMVNKMNAFIFFWCFCHCLATARGREEQVHTQQKAWLLNHRLAASEGEDSEE